MAKKQEWKSWWQDLTKEQKKQVYQWLSQNKPPEEWKYGRVAWAYTECPRGIFTGKYGNIW